MAIKTDGNGNVLSTSDKQFGQIPSRKSLLEILKEQDISAAFIDKDSECQELVLPLRTAQKSEKKEPSIKIAEILQKFLEHKDNLVGLSRLLFPHYHTHSPSPLHYRLSDLLLKSEDSIGLAFPREYAKSTYLTVFFFAWNLIFGKYRYIMYVTSSEDNAKEQLENAVVELISHPILKQLISRVKTDNSTVFEYENYAGETFKIKCVGQGTRVRGTRYGASRPDIIIIDDMEDAKYMRSEAYRLEVKRWFNSDIKGLSVEARIFLSGTILHDDSLLNNIIKNPPLVPKFNTFLFGVLDENGQSTWESKFPLELINRMEEDARSIGELDAYYMERHNICLAPENQIFKQEYFRYFDNQTFDMMKGNVYYFTSIDLASSTGEHADYTAIVTVAVNADNYWFVVDVQYGRWDSDERIKRIFATYRKYQPIVIGVEKGIILNEMRKNMEREMFATNTFINFTELSPYGRSMNKEMRITESLQARFKAGQVWFLEKADWNRETTMQLKLFPKYGHDDIADALAYISDIAYAPSKIYNGGYTGEIINPSIC